MNKEQIKHWTDVLNDVAIGQFLFFGGKNLYIYSQSNDFEYGVLAASAAIYLVIHAIIHRILSIMEE